MNRRYFTTAILKEEGIRLDYYILSGNAWDCNERMCTTYGIEIRQTPLHTFSNCPYKVCALPDITDDAGKIVHLLRELADSFTDPTGLVDVVEEIV